jgi:prevent-host-death family protein
MDTYNLADAKAHLSELVERAALGETVHITRRGKPAAQIVPAEIARKRIDRRRCARLPTPCRCNRKPPVTS